MKLKTEGTFDAAHHLVGYKGKCSNVHGHLWRVVVWIEGSSQDLDKVGILWDFTNLKKILNELDHQDLNKILPFNPTAENICCYLLGIIKKQGITVKVRVYESPKSYAEIEG